MMSFLYHRNLGLTPPRPEEDPPAPWWDSMCDLSLLVAIVKHGMLCLSVCLSLSTSIQTCNILLLLLP